MKERPVIGVTLSKRRSFWIWMLHRLAVHRAGGRAVKITPGQSCPGDGLDGLIVGGGDDISFHLEREELSPGIRYDAERDALERDLLERAFARQLPVLGICRGAQIINLVRGGSLYRDISEVSQSAPRGRVLLPRKVVSIAEGSRLGGIMKCNPCRVNALHHQAVDRPGDGLKIVARDEHGIVQAIEAPEAGFLLGVQWHPEMLPRSVSNLNIFKALVQAAAA